MSWYPFETDGAALYLECLDGGPAVRGAAEPPSRHSTLMSEWLLTGRTEDTGVLAPLLAIEPSQLGYRVFISRVFLFVFLAFLLP